MPFLPDGFFDRKVLPASAGGLGYPAKAADRMRYRTCEKRILLRDFTFRCLAHRLHSSAEKYRDFLSLSIRLE
ncbi:hypothetical protein [Burkholderia sp. WSM2232]|uniref:hypothetical protein n=1 Tax=Burkholderia sp. WSM2232 TaxID=944436 RepID=UPI0012EC17CF|nr:hypothetical protein [Burkholderia sp. WSM2232]